MNGNDSPAGSAGALTQYPVTSLFAGLVLLALGYLVLTRWLFGRISIEAGTR